MSTSVYLTVHIVAREEDIDFVRSVLVEMVEPTRQEPGCLFYELTQSEENSCEFMFIEKWESQDALNEHQKSDHAEDGGRKLEDKLQKDVELRFYRRVVEEEK